MPCLRATYEACSLPDAPSLQNRASRARGDAKGFFYSIYLSRLQIRIKRGSVTPRGSVAIRSLDKRLNLYVIIIIIPVCI